MTRQVIIVGGGRVGRHAAEELSEIQNSVTVVELDAERCDQVSPKVARVVTGDGTDAAVLEEAGVADADVVAALTDDTRVNLAVCEMVRERTPDARTILRIAHDGEQDYGYRTFVDDVVYPAIAGAKVAVDRISRV